MCFASKAATAMLLSFAIFPSEVHRLTACFCCATVVWKMLEASGNNFSGYVGREEKKSVQCVLMLLKIRLEFKKRNFTFIT